jgi:hypothetical protein
MSKSIPRALALALVALLASACGGAAKEPEHPQTTLTDGSITPDKKADAPEGKAPTTIEPVTGKTASADNGSDIIPPFPSSGPGAAKDKDATDAPAKPAKKKGAGGKKKKKT